VTLVKKTARSRGQKYDRCRISVVVPTYKRPDLLKRCLQALMQQDLDPACYEVIVVDDAACDCTREQVEHLVQCEATCHTIRYVPVTGNHGPAAARNTGWRAARGEIIAFTDDDCIPTPGWLRAGLAAFEPGIIGVSGKLIVPLCGNPTDYERNAAQLETSEFITANCFYRRVCLEAIGGFDERFSIAWREDSDLLFTMLRYAGAFVFSQDAVVIHPVRPAQWGISLKQQRKSMYNALLYKKHPRLYRERIQAAPPWHYYGNVGALLLMLIALLNKKPRLALIGMCLWALLTGRFCLQRLEQTSHEPHHVAEMIITSVLIPPLSIYWRLRGAIKFRVFFL
jgi:glycosyltransferase involved in cell wall biosynthesis